MLRIGTVAYPRGRQKDLVHYKVHFYDISVTGANPPLVGFVSRLTIVATHKKSM